MPGERPRSKDENQQQTQPTYDTGTGNRTRATLVEGECSHHCAIPAHQRNNHKQITDQIEHNTTKNPNWRQANQLAIYKRGRDSNLGPPGCEYNALTTRPRYLLWA